MADPQLKNGFTMIPNELLEALSLYHLSPNQWQIIFFIIRKTYGFQKVSDHISNFQISEATGLRKEVISRALKKLASTRVIIRNKRIIALNTNYTQWEASRVINYRLSELSIKVNNIANNKLSVSSKKDAISGATQNKKENKNETYTGKSRKDKPWLPRKTDLKRTNPLGVSNLP